MAYQRIKGTRVKKTKTYYVKKNAATNAAKKNNARTSPKKTGRRATGGMTRCPTCGRFL